ncbi:eukaryotic translation initiation factor 3 subunit 6 [Phaffia rhodozyma]|uniref:Eukaryotic translation initiation factor 3 subunit L n=1 Tax=Phaffia rhodozyma TaxID=264483 RepID=A0A0F7SF84_PHARH|nr:eukaryotic translation initiation factor 3 subunit 6 [Phaffia rhodozyma]
MNDEELSTLPQLAVPSNLDDSSASQAPVGSSSVPEDVAKFIVKFHQALKEKDLPTLTAAYERGWNALTQQHYSQSEWPSEEAVASLVDNDQIFLTLYRELSYRHIYARLRPNIDDRFHSYETSCELFNFLLNSDGPVDLELPGQWVWDLLDEFIWQFQSFGQYRGDFKGKGEEEIAILAEGNQVWSCYSVLNVLYSLIQKSNIREQLIAEANGASPEEVAQIAGEYGSKPLYRNLGYFSIICLLRVHVLLGDFTLALKVMDPIPLTRKADFTKVTACHVAVYYYVGFAYLSLGRYADAAATFVSILRYFSRMQQFHTRSYQYGQISKTCDRMYALLAICTTLAPGPVEDATGILQTMKEQLGDKLTELSRGSIPTYSELYLNSCPKFISANPPPYDDAALYALYTSSPPVEAPNRHLSIFLADVESLVSVPTTRSLLKLYTSIDAGKLGGLTDEDDESVLVSLMVAKWAGRAIRWSEGDAGLLDGKRGVSHNLDFYVDNGMIQVAETTESRRFATHFIRKAEAAQRVHESIRSAPLPITKPGSAQSSTAAAAGGAGTSTGQAGSKGGVNGQGGAKGPRKTVAWGAARS